MKRLVVNEHTRIERGSAGAAGSQDCASLVGHLYDRLRAFDHTNREDRVFDWFEGYARTTQWVGVVQVPGVQVEILPKIDALAGADATADSEDAQYQARRNLLYMLSVSGDVPVRSRDVARLATRQAPLSETLAALFADRLRQELLRGPERGYQRHEANLRSFKGKLLVPRQVLRNAAHRERFYCGFDEFTDDTIMNRIFRASCRALLEVTRTPATQDVLRHCLLLLDGVTDVGVQDADFGRITINRQNERFADVLRFCRLLLAGWTPTVQAGGTQMFSLLFDMNKVFERFIAAFLCRHVAPRFAGVDIFPHAGHHKRYLMEESDGLGVLRLEPDILVEGPEGRRLVMDTKWKLLSPSRRGRGGVAESDLYQLCAYTRRYGCARSVLLYPFTPGLESRDFDILDAGGERRERVAIRHVRLFRNLQLEAERAALAGKLEEILREGLNLGERGEGV
ncbi:MAG: McrC family protein [Myxococcales bacterium]|nr:McrC family protein [Myxococcales bacterium]